MRGRDPRPAPTSSEPPWLKLDRVIPSAAVVYAAVVFLVFVYPTLRTFPFSDEWDYVRAVSPSGTLTLDWLMAPNLDHRIPIQKLLQVLLLRSTDGDFRSLVVLNVAAAILASLAWLSTAAMMRGGRRTAGDAVIPLFLLSCGFTSVNWGFSFQFVSSVMLVSICVWA